MNVRDLDIYQHHDEIGFGMLKEVEKWLDCGEGRLKAGSGIAFGASSAFKYGSALRHGYSWWITLPR